jgi:hypothetical protein
MPSRSKRRRIRRRSSALNRCAARTWQDLVEDATEQRAQCLAVPAGVVALALGVGQSTEEGIFFLGRDGPPYAGPFRLLGQLVDKLRYDLVVRLLLPIRVRRVELEFDADDGMPTNFVSSRKMGMTVPLSTRGMKISRSNVGQILSEWCLSRMQTT